MKMQIENYSKGRIRGRWSTSLGKRWCGLAQDGIRDALIEVKLEVYFEGRADRMLIGVES